MSDEEPEWMPEWTLCTGGTIVSAYCIFPDGSIGSMYFHADGRVTGGWNAAKHWNPERHVKEVREAAAAQGIKLPAGPD